MEKDPYNEIISFLDFNNAEYLLCKHKPVITSKEAKEVKGSKALGVKSLLFKTEKGLVLLVLPGERKVSSKKIRSILGVSDVRLVSHEEVLSVMGCEVGGCYPFGLICGVKMIVDDSVKDVESIIFNVGRRDRSVEMKWKEFERLVPFEMDEIS